MTTSTATTPGVESDLRRELAGLIDRGELELPVLSHSATRIASMCLESDSDTRSLAEILNRDPALAGHVLRVANSSSYAPAEPIVSLQQAISRLGLRTLGQIAFAIALGSRVFRVPGHDAWVRELWRHSTLTAGWAREISRARRCNGEGAFLCGLLHDVGAPVLLQAAVDLLERAKCKAERAALEPIVVELHGPAGARLAEAWKMPPWIAQAMLHHHDASGVCDHADEVLTTQLVGELAHWTAERPDEPVADLCERLRALGVLEALSLYDDEFEALVGRKDKVVAFAGDLA